MSETEINELAVVDKKRQAWGQLGVATHETELSLIDKGVEVVRSLGNFDIKQDNITDAEALLKQAKAERASIHESRKEVTSRFDSVIARLMEPEKGIDEAVKTFSINLIAQKKLAEQAQAKDQAKIDEKKYLREMFSNQVSAEEARILKVINDGTAACLTESLEGDVKPEEIADQIQRYKDQAKERDWSLIFIDVAYSKITKVEYEEIKKAETSHNSLDYYEMFCSELDARFSDYTVAHANKADALAIAGQEKADREKEINANQGNQEAANKLESSATHIAEVSTAGKALKKTYEMDMEETRENAIFIMAAFVANTDLCLAKLRVTKWFAFTPKQAGIALAKVKTDDNNFQPSGVVFKEIAKL